MGASIRPGLVLLAAFSLGAAGALIAPQAASRVAGAATTVSPATRNLAAVREAQSLNGRVSQLTPIRTMEATTPQPAPAANSRATAADVTLARAGVRVIPTLVDRPMINTLQYVPTPRNLESEIRTSLISQSAIRAEIGTTGSLVTLPGVLRQADEAGNVVQFKAFAIAGRPLVYDAASRVYRGTITLGVTNILPGDPVSLAAPVVFQILDADSAEPAETRFESTSPPFKTVQITLSAVRPVQVLSALIPDGGVSISLRLNPMLSIEPGQDAIDGLGLEATPINISLLGVEHPGGRVVTLSTDAGHLEPTRVQLDEQGNASVTLRSGSVGTAHIRATVGADRAETTVRLNFPWVTLLASLLGGLAGGFVRSRGLSKRRALAVAAVWGLIVFVCYAVGIKLLPFTPTVTVGVGVVFVVSALGALLGTGLLKRS